MTTTNLTSDEREERLKDIRRARELGILPWSHLSSPTQQFEVARDTIDLLLFLLDSQAANRSAEETAADIVREWSEHDMNESCDSAYLREEFGAGHLEERIAVALNHVATRMRDKCVERLRELAEDYNSSWARQALKDAAREVQSLTLDQTEGSND